jgi:hypothetical protein
LSRWQTVRWCLVVMKFDKDLNARMSRWLATANKRLIILVAMTSLGLVWTVLLTRRHPCLQV